MTDQNRGSSLRGAIFAGSSVGGIGCAVPIVLIAAIFLGRQLDSWLGTKPWIMLGLLAAGIVMSAGYMVYSAFTASQAAYRDYQASQMAAGRIPPDYPRDLYEEESN